MKAGCVFFTILAHPVQYLLPLFHVDVILKLRKTPLCFSLRQLPETGFEHGDIRGQP